jgi:hypothetical protein
MVHPLSAKVCVPLGARATVESLGHEGFEIFLGDEFIHAAVFGCNLFQDRLAGLVEETDGVDADGVLAVQGPYEVDDVAVELAIGQE